MLNPKKKRKECYFAGILAAAAAISLLSGCCGGTPSLEEALKKTASYEQTSIPSPASDSLGGEWTVIALARSGKAAEDAEGLQTMRTLARNMTFLMKSIALGKEAYGLPEREPGIATNFIR